ncbi:MAG: hypothetical protein GVY27_09915 [Deinococcus-Thermus bacterium]|jgi:predicted transcriptional regulator|nr:hypothetical protein [Deinococcota bacterium]
MSSSTTKKMHLPLSPDLHAELTREAEAAGIPATVLAREAIEAWLERRRRQRVAEQLHAFAERHGGTELDLDEAFEEAAVDAQRGTLS